MTKSKLMIAIFCAMAWSAGCASTSGTGSNDTQTAADAIASEGTSGQSSNGTVETPNGPNMPQNCRTPITDFIQKSDGSLELLTSDGILRHIDNAGNIKTIRKLEDKSQNYVLLPTQNVLIHHHDDKIMLEHHTGQELFKLSGDPTKRKVFFSHDATELAILHTNGKYNVWNTEKDFGGITLNERVQDFFKRQSPDHQLGFPGEVRALGIGKDGRIAVAMDTPEDGKVGLLYLLDNVKAPGALKNMGRTNTPVKKIIVSETGEFITALDEPGQLYFTSTITKGFVVFARAYNDVKDITMHGNSPIIVRPDQVMKLDHNTGNVLYTLPGNYDTCDINNDKLYCSGHGVISIYQANDGKPIRHIGFKDETYAILENDALSGTCH